MKTRRDRTGTPRRQRTIRGKPPRNMWDRWTLPCCALTTRYDKGDLRKLDWKRSFGVLRSSMLRFWKWSLLRGFFRYKSKTEKVTQEGNYRRMYKRPLGIVCREQACVWYGPGTEVLVRFFCNWQEEFQEDLIKGSGFSQSQGID
jgi:hypothetical protein